MRLLIVLAVACLCACASASRPKFDPQNIATWPKCAYPLLPETTNEQCQVGDEEVN